MIGIRQSSLLFAAVALACWSCAAGAGEFYEGVAKSGSGELLYRERHWVVGDRHLVLYVCPDGKAFARKRLDASPGEASPDFEVLDARDGYRVGVETEGGKRSVFVQEGRGAGSKKAALQGRPVIDAGFDAYLRAAWQRLASGPQTIEFLVPSRLRSMRFRVSEIDGGDGVRRFRLRLGNLLGAVLPQIEVDYAADSRRLLRYRGVSDVRDVRDGDGAPLHVDIRFPRERRQAGAAELEQAAATRLDGRCLQ